MPLHNLILNGTFDSGAAHWTGNDIEASYNQSSYISGGSGNRVAELDGHRGQTTVMQQSFSVDNPITTQLTFDVALRTASNSNAGIEGFEVEILDDAGNVVSSMTVLPTTNSFNQVSLDITFPAAGDYTLRFTEIGPNDSLGAIIDNVEMMVCFCAGTLIETAQGQRRIEDLRPGDMIVTARGLRPLRWMGRRPLSRQHLAQNRNCARCGLDAAHWAAACRNSRSMSRVSIVCWCVRGLLSECLARPRFLSQRHASWIIPMSAYARRSSR